MFQRLCDSRLFGTSGDIVRLCLDVVRSVFHSSDRKSVVKMYVCHQWNMNLFPDFGKRPGRIHVWHCTAYDVTSGFFKLQDLRGSRLYVLGFCICHGLYQNWIPTAYHTVPDPHCLGFHSFFLHTYP